MKKLIYKLGSAENRIFGINIHYNDLDPDCDVLEAGSSKEIKELLQNYSIQTGDLLYWSEKGKGFANHATIISKVDENGIYYAGNTSARFDKLVTEEKFEHYKKFI